jgi:hypothetical protein
MDGLHCVGIVNVPQFAGAAWLDASGLKHGSHGPVENEVGTVSEAVSQHSHGVTVIDKRSLTWNDSRFAP